MKVIEYKDLFWKVRLAGYFSEIKWALNIQPCNNANAFANEAVWVILCSGFKEQSARPIMNKILAGENIKDVVRHPNKAKAISYVYSNKNSLFKKYQQATDKLDFLRTLPHIGDITKYHLAKNLGLNVVKPDRHLVRIAGQYNMTPLEMCQKLSKETGHKLAVIDSVIWRAANLGFI